MTAHQTMLVVTVVGLANLALLYRRIKSIATITVTLWIGTIVTVIAVVATGVRHFDPKIAFAFPPGAFTFSLGFLLGLGAASRIGVYDYLGYYDVCYIGDEVENPGRVIPRSILISTLAVAAIYLAINLSIIGVVPWRDFVPAATHAQSNFIVSIFMERTYGPSVATIFTAMILWTAFGSVFAAGAVCGGEGRLLLQGVRAPARDAGVPLGLARRARRPVDFRRLRIAGDGHRCVDHDADPGAVRRTDRCIDLAAPARSRHAAAVSHVVLPVAEPRRFTGMDFRLCDDTVARDRFRFGRTAPRRDMFWRVVVEGKDVAV